MLKLDFIMPKQKKKSRKAGKRERSPSPQVSEPEPELLPTPTDEEVPEPTLSKNSTCDIAIPLHKQNPKRNRSKQMLFYLMLMKKEWLNG